MKITVTEGTKRFSPHIMDHGPRPNLGLENTREYAHCIEELHRLANELAVPLPQQDFTEGRMRIEIVLISLQYRRQKQVEALHFDLLSRALRNLSRLHTIKFDNNDLSSDMNTVAAGERIQASNPRSCWPCDAFQRVLLSLWYPGFVDISQTDKSIRQDTLHGIFDSTSQLEELHLEFTSYELDKPGICMKILTGEAKLPPLRKLALDEVRMDSSELVDWLLRFSKSLEVVQLGYMMLTQGHWIGVLDSLRHGRMENLRKLYFESIHVSEEVERRLGVEKAVDWDWERDQSELCGYVQGKTAKNTYVTYYRDWFRLDDNDLEKTLSQQ